MPFGAGGEFAGQGGGGSGGGGGAVSSVSNADGTLTVSPTTGAVVASRAALTGDATASAGSNVTSVVQVHGVAISAAQATLVSQLNQAQTRNTSTLPVTVGAGEQTVLTGSTASQTVTLPTSAAQVSSPNLLINLSSVPVTVAFGSGTTGNRFGVAGSFNLVPGTFIEFYLIGTVWYMTRYSLAPPQLFTATGTATWIPSGTGNAQFSAILVGAGGGGATGNTSTTGGGGGGGGQVYYDYLLGNVTANQTITIPAGATAGNSGAQASIGSLLIAPGGLHGTAGGNGGAGGDGTNFTGMTLTSNSQPGGSGGGISIGSAANGGPGGSGVNGLGAGGGCGAPINHSGGAGGNGNGGAGGVTNAGGGGGAGGPGTGTGFVAASAGTGTQGGGGGSAANNSGGGGGGGGGASSTFLAGGTGGSGYAEIRQIG